MRRRARADAHGICRHACYAYFTNTPTITFGHLLRMIATLISKIITMIIGFLDEE